jgi:hypothetical protein
MMNCARNRPRTRTNEPYGEVVAIGDLIPAIPIADGTKLERIEELDSPAAKAEYAARVLRMMAQFPAAGSASSGKQRKQKLIALLEQFSRTPPVTIAVPRGVWRDLHDAAAYVAAKEEQWDSSCGPLIAASNLHLHVRLGWSKARSNLARMARYGLVTPYKLPGNGKRHFGISKGPSEPDASGWSLAPLVLLEDYLTELAERERRIADHHMRLPQQISGITSTAYRLIRPYEQDALWAGAMRWKLDALAQGQRKYARRRTCAGTISQLKRIHNLAERLLDRILNKLGSTSAASMTEEPGTRVPRERHHQYSINPVPQYVTGLPEDRSGNVNTPRSASTNDAGGGLKKIDWPISRDDTDPHGIARSGFDWSEAPALFPCIKGMINLGDRPGLNELHSVAQACQISQATAAAASGALGTQVALLCALITGQHMSEGKIRKTSDAYMRGLISKARAGDLNIGHTLFGRRESIYGRRDINQIGRVRVYEESNC